ncbi:hypothetical protein BN1723_010541 [Verticillium longisporum]|uniref:DNA-directed DNA polymerase n=1 Tax=Verticillium longisporum TaxID=100787 RepID=A0A0G4KZC1_VERLO|nr:hypothetical protein BN1723_010541 [Verticillium longisporum]
MDLFRVRLNCLDHYQGTSTRFDPQLRNDVHPSQAAKGPKVPIVRAFGSTETGQKVCAHIHGAFPYMYVEYSGSLEQDEVGAYIYRLHLSIDHALAVSYRRDQYSGNAKFVARVTLVKGIPFYGFHVGYKFFLKIYMSLQQLLNNRQLALKLLANVTYGYTSASFSGRMPCSEIADSIVQTGRETLERAIAFIHSQERWNAEVVYGDTDSLFIHLKGSTKDQAFDIGNEIAKEITDMNPRPIKLKFEKVYHPCVLLAKKRYVGYKYESKSQVKPDFDAKGIETVRRDGTPAEQKIEEKALKLLFETADLSQVKAYFQAQCEKIMRGTVSIQDFCFAKEVKLGSYSDKGPPPPGAMISTKRMLEDARAEPQYGERVPYVVVTGAPGARLIDRCVAPETLLRDSQSQLDAEYYISKNLIPPLERIFNLVGANVRQWYDDMPKVQRVRRLEQRTAAATHLGQGPGQGQGQGTSRKTLESYMKSASCIVCDVKMKVEGTLCERCRGDVPPSILNLQSRLMREEKRYLDVVKLCRSCAALPPLDDVACDSKDCPVFYSRVKQATRLAAERSVLEPVIKELGAEAARAALEW